jgi:hypothetical protein
LNTETNQNKLRESNGDLSSDKKGKIGRINGKMNKPKQFGIKVL